MNNKVYHGSYAEVKEPNINKGRIDVDFGQGFYTTPDENMAKKWACNKNTSIVNEYEIDYSGLKIKKLNADIEWLQYVVYNRTKTGCVPFDESEYDIIIGPTADDKLFTALDLYIDDLVPDDKMIEIINCMNLSEQVVIKKQSVLDNNIVYLGSKELIGFEKNDLLANYYEERRLATQKAKEIIKGLNR